MITAQLLDVGTCVLKNPATYPPVPGMDRAYFNESDFEEDNVAPRQEAINNLILATDDFELRPWPEKLSNRAWVDNTPRYETDGLSGLQLNLHRFDRLTGETPFVPAGEWYFDLDDRQQTDREKARVVRELTWREVQDRAENPAEWLRLDVINRAAGGTDLEDPLFANWQGLRGNEFRLELPDNVLFAPFDLTHEDRYRVLDEAGDRVDPDLSPHLLNLYNGGHYRIYLRPRKWRYVATCVAHYWYISGFEYFRAQEIFTRAHTHRPPYYPIRHNLIQTTKTADLPDYFGNYHSYDTGINWQWEHSRSAAALSREIIDGQYWTKLVVKIFGGNSAPWVTVSTRPPDFGDIVLGIGRIDSSGRESIYWIQQVVDLVTVYPWEVLGSYLVPWYVTI